MSLTKRVSEDAPEIYADHLAGNEVASEIVRSYYDHLDHPADADKSAVCEAALERWLAARSVNNA